jgi:glucosamine--fructose-6-phosphate aminotransferase (isomerizing)
MMRHETSEQPEALARTPSTAAQLAEAHDTLVTGRGIRYGTALEVALKLEETCLRPVRGLSYADLKHGPMAVVDAALATVLVAAPTGPTVGRYDPGRTRSSGHLRPRVVARSRSRRP